jgi:hypothetical protein
MPTKTPIKYDDFNGFFFGATQREFKLAEKHGDCYRFAFIVLNEDKLFGEGFKCFLN